MRLASGYDVERLNARSRAYNDGKVATAMDYVYINGKPVTCRRCKRKRVKSERPEHLQFKTCNPCRVIERAQKRRGNKITLYRNREEYEILRRLKMIEENEPYQTPDEELAMSSSAHVHHQPQHYVPESSPYIQYGQQAEPQPVDDTQHQLHAELEKAERYLENNAGLNQAFNTVLKNFDFYLMLLKVNQSQNVEQVIFSEVLPLEKLLKSALSKDTSVANIVLKLYDKFIMPISKITGYDFRFQSQIDFVKYATIFPVVIREYLKCTDDNEMAFEDDNIDSELIALQKAHSQKYLANESCSSSLFLSYHTETGQLVICFSHKAH
ncbi:hypothetical protein CANARDRAFT_182216, partial [[Candida] arabinofermentans NRRL YB-2248]